MSINKGFLVEIERETSNTRRLLERLKDENLAYKPHEKSMSLGALASHIVALHNWIKDALSVDVYDLQTMYSNWKAESTDELLNVLNIGYAENVMAIESISDESWQQVWSFQAGDHIIAQMPRMAAYRFIIQNHLIHHRGQLTVYMRLLDIPLPGLYGPSADEQ